MKKRASKTAKSRGIRFVNITPNVTRAGSSSCVNGYSLQNEYVINDEQPRTVQVPYELTLNVDDLIYPSKNSRRSKKTDDPPRPQNSFLLFRRDFEAKYRLLHKNEKIFSKKISTLAAERYKPNKKKQDPNVLEGTLTFVTSQSQDIEIPTQSSNILEKKVFENKTKDVMYDSNTYIHKEENTFDYNY
ncbi:11306_t:CDS:2, partial [Dentiscutata heterogama]